MAFSITTHQGAVSFQWNSFPSASFPSTSPVGPTSSGGPTSPEDFAVIADLLETIDRDPSAVEARKVLAQQYENFGWLHQAAQEIRTILALQPGDAEATAWLVAHVHNGGDSESASTDRGKWPAKWEGARKPVNSGTVQDLQTGYKSLMADAKSLTLELQIFQELCGPSHNFAGQIADLKAISEGRLASVVKIRPPPAARAVAGKIKSATTQSAKEDAAFNDLEANARWLRNRNNNGKTPSNDEIRTALLKRTMAIKSALPQDLSRIVDIAFAHTEHEVLLKTYLNTETMLGDPVSSIARSSFFVSEDGYAWDLSELASAISANGGVMRNPLSRQMFSADDVKSIIRHPLGKDLGALQLQQKELTRGIRKETVTRLEKMAKILHDDQSADSAPSREAVEDFTLYMATLPTAEQEALDKLKVPATDSHTGNAFDTTIGDAVADAKANRQCFHKTADLLRQAAKWLRKNSGVGGSDAKMPGAWD